MTTLRYGATTEEWSEFSVVQGLTADLLPVVSNPNAKIGESSKLKALGKTPSRYNKLGTVGGILDWTLKQSTPEEVSAWSKQPDYGICIQTRHVRAIDVDVSDAAMCAEIKFLLAQHELHTFRSRSNSSKFLAAFILEGEYTKRTIKTKHGIIEFLAQGQQFIAAGTHPSGVRYQWNNGIDLVTYEAQHFELLWDRLQEKFGIEPSTTLSTTDRKAKLNDAIAHDETAQRLAQDGWILSTERDGRLHIRCPFADQHTGESSDSATTYFPANTGGFSAGHFKCLHAHCAERTDAEFRTAIGITAADDFIDLDDVERQHPAQLREPISDRAADGKHERRRYTFQQAAQFAQGQGGSWIIKGILPLADLAVVFGESGSGKSFFTLDLASHIAQGRAYRGKKTSSGAVAYIAAEGAGGFKNRLRAYAEHHQLDLSTLPLHVLAAQPNFMRRDNVEAVRDAILQLPQRPSIIVVDTWAQVTPGANENSGEDMGRALGHARQLHAATGAMILLIHHSGKDATKGIRGWSGLHAAADAEIEITHAKGDPQRVATISKLREGQDQLEMSFRLDVVNLGTDQDGDPITSCVVVPTDQPVRSVGARVILGDLERLVLRVLDEVKGLSGEDVKINDLIEAVVAQRVPPDGRDTRRQVTQKALDRLVEKGQLSLDGGLVKVVGQ